MLGIAWYAYRANSNRRIIAIAARLIMNLWRRLRRKRIPLSELKTADIMATKSSLEHSVGFAALVGVGLIIECSGAYGSGSIGAISLGLA